MESRNINFDQPKYFNRDKLELNLSNLNLTANDVPNIVSFIKYYRITTLNLNGNKIGDDGVERLFRVENDITELYLHSNNIGEEGVAILVNQQKLVVLDLSGNYIDDVCVYLLAFSENNIQVLSLAYNGVPQITFQDLACNPVIRTLDLSGNCICEIFPQALLDYNNHSLKTLILRDLYTVWFDISYFGKAAIQALSANPNLTTIDLSGNNFLAEDVSLLCESKTLKFLYLGLNNITDTMALKKICFKGLDIDFDLNNFDDILREAIINKSNYYRLLDELAAYKFIEDQSLETFSNQANSDDPWQISNELDPNQNIKELDTIELDNISDWEKSSGFLNERKDELCNEDLYESYTLENNDNFSSEYTEKIVSEGTVNFNEEAFNGPNEEIVNFNEESFNEFDMDNKLNEEIGNFSEEEFDTFTVENEFIEETFEFDGPTEKKVNSQDLDINVIFSEDINTVENADQTSKDSIKKYYDIKEEIEIRHQDDLMYHRQLKNRLKKEIPKLSSLSIFKQYDCVEIKSVSDERKVIKDLREHYKLVDNGSGLK